MNSLRWIKELLWGQRADKLPAHLLRRSFYFSNGIELLNDRSHHPLAFVDVG